MILRWEQGRDVVDDLLARGSFTRVTPNRELADTLLDQARAHLASGAAVVDADPAGAFTLVYDAARKALTAILANQGLRAGGDARTQFSSMPFSRSSTRRSGRSSGRSPGCARCATTPSTRHLSIRSRAWRTSRKPCRPPRR